MTFNVLSLKNTFAAGDQQYISDFNTNFGNITTMFTDARADIDSLANLQGQKIVDDVLRKISASDKSGGALGPYSFVIDLDTTNTIKLTHGNADGYSYGYVGTERFSTNATLQYDMSSQSTGTYYVGITGDSSTGDVTIQVNATEGQISLPLYSVEYDATADTLTNPKRIDRTVLFSNTLLQSMLETPQSIYTKNSGATSAGSSAVSVGNIRLPIAHRLHSLEFCKTGQTGDWYGDLNIKIKNAVGSIVAGTTVLSATIPSGTAIGTLVVGSVSATYAGLSFPSITQYEIELQRDSGSTGSIQDGIEWLLSYIPTYNLPVTN